ncbi:hypothetical protein MYX65_06255 [Acidobacteria bacterium AH-259-L09]|nr:hypothetical protein [Acidobacteria bacterium AH-259-L09]
MNSRKKVALAAALGIALVGTMNTLRGKLKAFLSDRVERALNTEVQTDETIVLNDMEKLYQVIRKGDVVLIEGRARISQIIKLFTQSQWSHAALYIGDDLLKHDPSRRQEIIKKHGDHADKLILEALIEDGVVANPLEKYRHHNLRICRPVNIKGADLKRVLESALNDLWKQYDRRNVLHLALQLLPFNFGPFKKKSAEICIGACSEFQVICSGFIAKAFQRVKFAIRPLFELSDTRANRSEETPDQPVVRMQHPSRIAPRDFDLSSNFEIIKI